MRHAAVSSNVYNATARALHWLMAPLIILQLAMGFVMVWSADGNVYEKLTGMFKLYDVHKLLGMILLGLVGLRLLNRVFRGVPPEEVTLEPFQKEVANLVHAWIYLLLIVIPVLGWVGVSLYPALKIFDWFSLPPLTAADQKASHAVFIAHAWAAYALIVLVVMHAGAAIFHHFVRGDGVLTRMIPSLGARRRD